jgi:Cu2+-exporting ATPase
LLAAAKARGIEPLNLDSVVEKPGLGLMGSWRGQSVRLGSRNWCGASDASDDEGLLEIVLKVGNNSPVAFTFEDMSRPEAGEVIASLRRQGLTVEMLSGDRAAAVARTARELGLDAYLSRMSPQAKLARVEEFGRLGHKVLVVGDGINDAPALAAGFTSMAPATASDIGRTAADVVFMGRSLKPVTLVRSVAIATQSIARQNVTLAIGYNILAVPIAMLGLATPLIAALAMSSSSIIVIANALRLGLRIRGMPAFHDLPAGAEMLAEAPGEMRSAA